MLDKDILIKNIEKDLEFTTNDIKQELNDLRGFIDNAERKLENGRLTAEDSLQGNEWRLYKHFTKYQEKKEFLKQIEITIDEYD